MVDDKTILFTLICKNDAEAKKQLSLMSVINELSDFKFNVNVEIKSGSLAATCNRIQKSSTAKYKFFLTEPIVFLNPHLITQIVINFLEYPNFGMLGLYGSEMPVSGDYTKAKNIYGKYFYKEKEEVRSLIGKMPILYQEVYMIESGFFATSKDILFDENMDDDFFIAAQCCRYRQAGYNVGVVYLEAVYLIFSEYNSIYKSKTDQENYNLQLKEFREAYKDIVTPLVSICIPTYNQPLFFEIALQSALDQTYPNIEIIIGDDSTNEETKDLIQPYLEQYDNIKYFYHGKPLGQKGTKNTTFIVNKSSGEYINILFHDDIIMPEKISLMMEYFAKDFDRNIKLIVSSRMEIDENNQVTGRRNPIQFLKNEIMNGEKVARQMLFSMKNILGELSTALMRKSDLILRSPITGKNIFDIGVFCGVKDRAYGDMGTWLNLLKSGGKCVFMKDVLNTSRRHYSANTNDPWIRVRLYLEWLNYLTLAWLNNIYLRNFSEYMFCCRNWKQSFENEFTPQKKQTYKNEEELFLLKVLEEAQYFVAAEKYHEVLDCSIRFLLDVLNGNNAIMPLIRRNSTTGLWEKADDGIMLHGKQRC